MKKRNILVGSPVYQKPEILDRFLCSLKNIRWENEVDYIFVDDNKDPVSSQMLNAFSREGSNTTILKGGVDSGYECNQITHKWDDSLMLRVANYKNTIIQYAIDNQYDYLFFADSDLVIHPDLVTHLAKQGKEVVSEIFWSRWRPEQEEQPNVWLFDEYDLVPKTLGEELLEQEKATRTEGFLHMLKKPGIYEVGGLGACTLITRSALLKGVSFAPIKNLTIHGEDRFFCIRAAVLGIELFVDTMYPAYHIYRETDLAGVDSYVARCNTCRIGSGVTLSMVVKNESGRYLERVLRSVAGHIDRAVIIDDASTDDTSEICQRMLAGVPLRLVKNDKSMFSNEVELRKLQWAETLETSPEWVLSLDADEVIEESFWEGAREQLNDLSYERCDFRLFDMWSDTQYREDEFWNAHNSSRTFLIRHRKGYQYVWKEMAQHCGRFPSNCKDFKKTTRDYRVQHLGWARECDRVEKHGRYMRLDPNGVYGVAGQYASILDTAPNLKDWLEDEK